MRTFLILCCCFGTMAAYSQSHVCSEMRSKHSLPERANKLRYNDTLTRLVNQYDVTQYALNLTIEPDTNILAGYGEIQFKVSSPSFDSLTFELHPAYVIDSMTMNQEAINFVRDSQIVFAKTNQTLVANSLNTCRIYYHGVMQSKSSNFFVGIIKMKPSHFPNGLVYTHSEPDYNYLWMPCKQTLQDKADSIDIRVTTSSPNKVVANGLLVSIDSLANNKVQYHWHSNYPMVHYSIFLAVADYSIYQKKVPLSNQDSTLIYMAESSLNPNFYNSVFRDSVSNYLRIYSENLGLYPFHQEKFGQCLTSYFDGMENQTMVSLGTNYYNFNTIIHEMAHHWFGNEVTCKSWKDIFVNESMATYIETEFCGFGNTLWSNMLTDIISVKDGSVYCPDTTNTLRIFSSRLTYHKGAYILRTLESVIGKDKLFEAMRLYLQTYQGGFAGIEEFKGAVEEVTGLSLDYFFNEWIYGEGYPRYVVQYNYDSTLLVMKVTEVASAPDKVTFFHTPIQIHCPYLEMGDTTFVIKPDTFNQTFVIPLNRMISFLQVDPENWVLKARNANDVMRELSIDVKSYYPKYGSGFIFPNPANQQVFFNPDYSLEEYTLYDNLGNKVLHGKDKSFETNHLQEGTYLLRAKTTNGMKEEKLVIQHNN